MSRQEDSQIMEQMAETGTLLLRAIQRFNWILLAVIIAGSWFQFGRTLAQSVLIGGVLANVSFFLLRRDIKIFMENFAAAGMQWKFVRRMEKAKFFLKFYGRLATLAVILYFLINQIAINMIGLAIGLSTIMVSIIVVVLSKGSMLYSVQRYKGV